MKKLAIGCGVIVVLLAVAGGAGVYYITSKARGYLHQLQALADADKNIVNTASFSPPPSGELTAEMVQRFAAVQEGMHKRLGQRIAEITAKQDEFVRRMQAENRKDSSPMETFSVVKDLMGLLVQARTAQIDALNEQRFSMEEYSWVRGRVYAAGGMTLTEISLKNLPEALAGNRDVMQPLAEASEQVPKKNKDLVAPLLPRFKEWAPLAFFGM
jgi:hypothetical protein